MNKIYFVESELYPRTDFAIESDRNEMALALWQEHCYYLWARTLNWYEDGLLDGYITHFCSPHRNKHLHRFR